MRRISLSAAILVAVVTGPLSGCAHMGNNLGASRSHKMEARYDLARLAESDGQLDKARENYEAIYKKDPSNAEVCHRLGIVHAKQANYEAAKRYLGEAHKLSPTNPEVLNDWGYACFLANDLTTAESVFEKALKVAPSNKRATNNLALVYGNQGRFEESLRMFRQVNGEAEAHSNVAYLYAQNGDGKKALDHYSRALSLKPELKVAADGMLQIAELQQKMEADRAHIAQQNAPAATVAQVSAKDQPRVYPELTAAAKPQATADDFGANTIQAASVANAAPNQAVTATTAAPANQPQATGAQTASNDFAENLFEDDAELVQPRVQTTPVVMKTTSGTPAVVPAPLPVETSTPVLSEEFDAPAAVAQAKAPDSPAVITPSRQAQSLANVSDSVPALTGTSAKTDYAALCPQASDKVQPILVQLNSLDPNQMKLALHKLGELNTDGVSGAPAARAAMTHADAYVRIHAALALYRIEQNTNDTVPVFVEGLRNTDANVRSFAATALSMGPKVNDVVPPLTAILNDANPFVRLHAAETLYKCPGNEATAVKSLIEHLDHKDANVRWLSIFIMGEALPKSQNVVEALTLALYDSDNRIRAGAAFALGGIGRDAQAALPELKELAADQNPEVRQSVQDAIREIEGNTSQANASR